MKRLIPLLVVLALAGPPAWAVSFYESPDVPTDDPLAVTYLPWDVVRDDSGNYSLKFAYPANTPGRSVRMHRFCSGSR